MHWGTAASNYFPFGTEFLLPDHFGNKVFVIEDRMNKRYYQMLDIWYNDLDEARNKIVGFKDKIGTLEDKIEELEDDNKELEK